MSMYPDTLLCRFFGVFKIRFQSKVHLVILMNHAFSANILIPESYDLKGSTRNRLVPQEDIEKGACGKDLNFQHRIIKLGYSNKICCMKQMQNDLKFLEKTNTIDYSLLVGISPFPPKPSRDYIQNASSVTSDDSNSFPEHARSKYTKCFGGAKGSGNMNGKDAEIYFFNIIDILQPYNIKKKAETMYKSLTSGNRHEISSVPASTYSERFFNFMDKHIQ